MRRTGLDLQHPISICGPHIFCPGIYIIEDKKVKCLASKYLRWCVEASQVARLSPEVPRFDGGRGRRDQDPVRTTRGARVSERSPSRTREVIGPVFRLLHILDPSRGLTRVRKEIVNSTAPGAPRSGRREPTLGTGNRLAGVFTRRKPATIPQTTGN